jgi:hypothetical protein
VSVGKVRGESVRRECVMERRRRVGCRGWVGGMSATSQTRGRVHIMVSLCSFVRLIKRIVWER